VTIWEYLSYYIILGGIRLYSVVFGDTMSYYVLLCGTMSYSVILGCIGRIT
jgi:hypothetical protein